MQSNTPSNNEIADWSKSYSSFQHHQAIDLFDLPELPKAKIRLPSLCSQIKMIKIIPNPA
jgi:hypothetical protein